MISTIANFFCSDESDRVETSLKIHTQRYIPLHGFYIGKCGTKRSIKKLKFE